VITFAIRVGCSYCGSAGAVFEVARQLTTPGDCPLPEGAMAFVAAAAPAGWRFSHGSSGRGLFMLCPKHNRILPVDGRGACNWDLSYYDEEDARRRRLDEQTVWRAVDDSALWWLP
jgi:hypothetical protein